MIQVGYPNLHRRIVFPIGTPCPREVQQALRLWYERMQAHNGYEFTHNDRSLALIVEQVLLYIERSGIERTIDYINATKAHEIPDLDKDKYAPHPPEKRYLQRTKRELRAEGVVTINRPRNILLPKIKI